MPARYGHHDLPALDFCAEVAALQAGFARLALSPEGPGTSPEDLPPHDPRRRELALLRGRLAAALEFVPGAHLEAVIAKGELRALAALWE